MLGFLFMEKQEITPEVLYKVKNLERISWESYLELIQKGIVIRTRKLKAPRTIFYDKEGDCLVYLNPVLNKLHRCGVFVNDINI